MPNGSVLGPQLFCLYIRPLVEIIASTGLNHMCYADDLQVTIYFPARDWPMSAAVWLRGNHSMDTHEQTEAQYY